MPEPAKSSADRRFFLLWLLSGLLDIPLLWVVSGGDPLLPLPWAFLLHLLAAASAFLAPPKEKGFFSHTRHWGEALGFLTLFIPGIGWLLAGAGMALHGEAAHAKGAYRFDEDASDAVNPLAAAGTPAAVKKQLADAMDVLPAADALLSVDPALKRGALEVLARIRTPQAIAWIVRARSDAHPEVRFYATSALTTLKRDFETSMRAAEKEAFERPGELGPQLTLQRIRCEYARTGLLEPGTRAALLENCRSWLDAPARRDPEALRILYQVDRESDPSAALRTLERLVLADPARRERWLKEKADLLFRLGRHAEVRELMSELKPLVLREGDSLPRPEDLEWRAAIFWWTHG